MRKSLSMMISLFVLAFGYAIINNAPDYTAFDLGKTTGLMFAKMFKILGTIGLLVFFFRKRSGLYV